MPERFGIVGCGKVGITLAYWLAARGFGPAGFSSRTRASAQAAAAAAGGGRDGGSPAEVLAKAAIVFITTPDGVIAAVCQGLAAQGALRAGTVVLHCSGALSSDELAAARKQGCAVGSLHPLQSFAAPALNANPFAGIVMTGEGDAAALAVARRVAAALGAEFVAIPTDTKTLYHAAAVVASNYLVAVEGAAADLLATCGLDRREALRVLLPLMRGTLGNIERLGVPQALTGPIERGDDGTVRRHCEAIAGQRPDLLALYRHLGAYTLKLAGEKGGLSDRARAALAALLTPTTPAA